MGDYTEGAGLSTGRTEGVVVHTLQVKQNKQGQSVLCSVQGT